MRVSLHGAAPPKPEYGAPCNGCGLCCAVETCPLGMVRFGRRRGPCPALEWAADRYVCALLKPSGGFLGWLPRRWAVALAARWISAGSGCDCRLTAEP